MKALQLYRPAEEIRKLQVITEAVIQLPLAGQVKTELLERCAGLERVAGEKSQEIGLELLSEVGALIKQVGERRKEVKEPFLSITTAIDDVAKKYLKELETEKDRLKRILAEYQLELDKKRREEQARLDEENRKVEAEKQRIANEAAEQQRKLDAAAAAANSADELARIRKQQEEAQQQSAIAAANLELKQASLIQVAAPKKEGMSVKRPWRVEVLDAAKLYAARPDMVELKPRQAELNKLVAGDGGLREIPGCRVFEDIDVTAR